MPNLLLHPSLAVLFSSFFQEWFCFFFPCCLLVHWPKCSCSRWSVYMCSCSLIWVIVNSSILQRSVCSEFNHNYLVGKKWPYHSLLCPKSFSGFWRKSEAIGRFCRALWPALISWPKKIWICLLVMLQLFVPFSFPCSYKERKFC